MTAPHRRAPLAGEQRREDERLNADRDQCRPVPPGHRNGLGVLLVNQMIRVIRAEHAMMNQRMAFVRITEFGERPVHHVPMQDPFEHGTVNGRNDKTDRRPKDEV